MGLFHSKFWTVIFLTGVVAFSFSLYFLFSAGEEQVSAQSLPIVGSGGEIIVYISKDGFNPEKITVRAGTQVKWINKDTVAHRVAFTLGSSLDNLATVNQELGGGESLSFKFENAGDYSYFDRNSTYVGKVTVK